MKYCSRIALVLFMSLTLISFFAVPEYSRAEHGEGGQGGGHHGGGRGHRYGHHGGGRGYGYGHHGWYGPHHYGWRGFHGGFYYYGGWVYRDRFRYDSFWVDFPSIVIGVPFFWPAQGIFILPLENGNYRYGDTINGPWIDREAYHNNLGVGTSLPPIEFGVPPDVVAMPDTDDVYVVPDINVDMFFWNGWWWRPWEGGWYRSHYYDRGWAYYNDVPSFYFDVDPGWRGYYRDHIWNGHRWNYDRIPNQQLQQNWNSWHNNHYWEKQKNWGVQGYQPRAQQQRQELRNQRQQQYQQQHQGKSQHQQSQGQVQQHQGKSQHQQSQGQVQQHQGKSQHQQSQKKPE